MNKWCQERVVYQIYPRSFQDSNGDGIGDIPGIISRLDELKDLGIGILWLSPVYKSPDADNGYDISDYCGIDPKFGSMADMDALIAEAGKRDIKIVMDMVINHTSDEHEWFQKSRDRQSEYRDYYIWRPPKAGAKGGTKEAFPNNWTGFFMNDVWEYDERSGEYYLHLFDKKQPDLNYKNPKVIEEIKRILKFWLDKGVGGFRCDVINILYKTSLDDGKPSIAVGGIEHYKSQEGNHAILRELRRDVLDKYDCFTVGETVMVDLDEAKLLCAGERKELDMLFYFEHLEIDRRLARFVPKKFKAPKLLEVLSKWQRGLEWNAVYLENHDQSRIVSHFGSCKVPGRLLATGKRGEREREYWKRSAKLLSLLELTLRGTIFIYQGQEIGMTNFDFKSLNEVKDVESRNFDKLLKKMHIPGFLRWDWVKASSRDNARTPVQWNTDPNAGFTRGSGPGSAPWIGVNSNYTKVNYESQKDDPLSILNFYKKLIALRRSSETLKYGEFTPVYARGNVIAYTRTSEGETYTVILNFSRRPAKAPLPNGGASGGNTAGFNGRVLVSNTGRTALEGRLLPWEAVILHKKIL
jgi:oligo-1,6-glucosidase